MNLSEINIGKDAIIESIEKMIDMFEENEDVQDYFFTWDN